MNKVYKTVWNAVRGQLVVVNEATSSHAQADASTMTGSVVTQSKPIKFFAKTTIATVITAVLASPMAFAENSHLYDGEYHDISGSITTMDNLIIDQGAHLQNDLNYFIPELTQSNANATFKGTLTNAGTVEGDGVINAKKVVNQLGGTFTMGTLTLKNPLAGVDGLTNAGTMSIDTLDTANANVSNTGTVTVKNAYNLAGKFVNSGTLNLGMTNVHGELANSSNNATVDALNVKSNGKVTGSGMLNVTTVDVATTGNVAQNVINAKGSVTNAGKMTLTNLGLKGDMTNSGTATIGSVASIESGRTTLTNQSTGVLTISDSYEAKGSIDNSGTLDIGTLKNASLTNKKQATIASAQSNITNEATGNLTVNVAYSGDALVNKGQATVESFTGKSLNNSGSKLAVNKMTLTNGATFTNTATTGATVGTLNVTNGSVSGAGNLAVTGKATIAATTTFDQNKLTAKDLAVAGTLTTTDLTVTGSLKNDKTITSTGNADLTNLTQNASGTTTLQVATLKGTGKIDGTLTAKDALTFADGSTYTGAGAITAQKALNVNGNVTMTNKVVAKGDTTIATGKALTAKGLSLQKANVTGTLSNQGAAGTIANLNMTAGAKLANNDTLTVDTLSAGTGVTYTQTGTTATLTTKDGSWFKNSTINLHGGQLDRVAHGLGTGNTYTVKATGANQIPGGNLNNDSWKNGMSILKVGTLTGENSVELLEGGLLEVKNLELDQNTMGGKTLTLNGGAIETTLEEMFEGVKVEALNYETVDGNGKIEVSGASVLGVSNIGTVQKSIKDHATLTGGDLVFNNSITVDQVSKVSEALNQVSGGNVTVHFTGQTDKVFTVDVANSLITANDPTKVVFDSSTLYARDTTTGETGKTLYVGGQDSDGVKLNGTIGFSNVVETEKVVIQDGKGLALVGKGDKNYGSLVGDNGSVDIKGENSELVLGTTYRQNLTGKLNTVNIVEGGKLLAKGGDYKVTTITANASSVETLAGGKVTTDALSVTGIGAKLNNKGTIVAKSFTDDQNTVSLNKGALEVGKATTLAGKMTNQTGGSIKVNGALTVTGKLVNEAASVNRAGATGIEVAGLNVTAGEAVVNSGVIKSTGVNTITGKSVNAMKDGKWAFANKKGGVVDFTAGKTTIGEARSKAAGQTVFYNEDGTVKFGDVHIERLAVLYNKATAEKGDAVIEVGNLTMDGLATLNNSGTILGNVTSNGTIRNSGTMAGKQFATYTSFAAREPSKNEINNTLVNASDGQIGYYDIVAVNGQLQNEGKVFAGELILDGKSTSAAVENGGKLINTGKADAKPEDKKGYVEADHTELKNGAQLIQTANGSFTSNTLTINDTSIIDINTGTFSVVESLDLLGGTVALKDVKSTINLKKAFEGSIALDSGELVLGYIGSKGESGIRNKWLI